MARTALRSQQKARPGRPPERPRGVDDVARSGRCCHDAGVQLRPLPGIDGRRLVELLQQAEYALATAQGSSYSGHDLYNSYLGWSNEQVRMLSGAVTPATLDGLVTILMAMDSNSAIQARQGKQGNSPLTLRPEPLASLSPTGVEHVRAAPRHPTHRLSVASLLYFAAVLLARPHRACERRLDQA